MRWVSSVVPVHLVSLSSQPHTLLSRLVLLLISSSFLSLLRAHLHIRPSLNFLPPLREACECVCVPLETTGVRSDCAHFFEFFSRGAVGILEVTAQ